MKYLKRNVHNKILGGVCAGLGDYFKIDPLILRIAFVALFFVYGAGLIPYAVLWILLPSR